MIFTIILSEKAEEDIKKLKRDEPQSFKKLTKLLIELQEHPDTGTGQIERLSGDKSGQWSRRISKKHRLIYEIQNEMVSVFVISTYGHYSDK